jgi:putative membrane protein
MKLLRNILTVLFLLAMIVVGVLFALQNKSPVPLDLLVYTFEPKSLALWVLGAFALGGVLGMVVSSFILVRMRASLGSSKRQLDKVRTEVSQLRSEGSVADAS